jgi:hypothetical protein
MKMHLAHKAGYAIRNPEFIVEAYPSVSLRLSNSSGLINTAAGTRLTPAGPEGQ